MSSHNHYPVHDQSEVIDRRSGKARWIDDGTRMTQWDRCTGRTRQITGKSTAPRVAEPNEIERELGMTEKAMLLALEALGATKQWDLARNFPLPYRVRDPIHAAITALHQAIADEQQAGQHPDDAAVDRFAAAMKAKMAKQRAKGYSGWDEPEQCPAERLQTMLSEHIGKGDPVDVGNIAMMLFCRGEPTNRQPAQWVGLTDDDIDPDHPFIDSIRSIEAKLREKNSRPQPAQQPLTDEQMHRIHTIWEAKRGTPVDLIRAIERAHGIPKD
jgi:hypothetical protein